MESSRRGSSRRDFIKTVAVAAGTAGVLGACGKTATSPTPGAAGSPAAKTEGLPITVAGYLSDRVETLADGSVPIEGCNGTFEEGSIAQNNRRSHHHL